MPRHLPNVIGLALIVVANWLLSHIATSWVMPPEVAQAMQSLIVALLTIWVVQGPPVVANGNGNGDQPSSDTLPAVAPPAPLQGAHA